MSKFWSRLKKELLGGEEGPSMPSAARIAAKQAMGAAERMRQEAKHAVQQAAAKPSPFGKLEEEISSAVRALGKKPPSLMTAAEPPKPSNLVMTTVPGRKVYADAPQDDADSTELQRILDDAHAVHDRLQAFNQKMTNKANNIRNQASSILEMHGATTALANEAEAIRARLLEALVPPPAKREDLVVAPAALSPKPAPEEVEGVAPIVDWALGPRTPKDDDFARMGLMDIKPPPTPAAESRPNLT